MSADVYHVYESVTVDEHRVHLYQMVKVLLP